MMRPTKTMGKDALISCRAKFLHPGKIIDEFSPYADKGYRLENLLVCHQETKKVRGKETMCIVMVSHSVKRNDEPVELHSVPKHLKVIQQGPPEYFFTAPVAAETSEAVLEERSNENLRHFMDQGPVDATDAAEVSGLGVEVDDDNLPAPKNVVLPGEQVPDIFQACGHSGICYRHQTNAQKTSPDIDFPSEVAQTLQQLFEMIFCKDFLVDVLLHNSNQAISPQVTLGELLRWIRLWFLMATQEGADRRSFWSTSPPDPFSQANFRLHECMSRNRFEQILSSLKYTTIEPPTYKDGFYHVHQMIAHWNANMAKVFNLGWVLVLDESMSVWTNEYSCPGFMFVPRKPWPFGNEYHTICCALCGIMFRVELVEGKDRPRQMGPMEHDDKGGKMVGLLLRLTKPVWGTGKVVILDSGFSVLKGIIELKR